MQSQKLPHQLSVDELLKLLDTLQPEDKKRTVQTSPVLSFIQAFNIVPGKQLIHNKLLFRLFKLWKPDSVMEKRNFTIQLSSYIPRHNPKSPFFTIDTNTIQINEKLIKLVEEKTMDKTKSKYYNRHFLKFLKDTGLSEGKIYIENDILYYVYNNWLDTKPKKTKLGPTQFMLFCDLHFDRKRLSNSKLAWYGVSKEIYNLIDTKSVQNWRDGRKRKYVKDDYQTPYKKNRKKAIYQT